MISDLTLLIKTASLAGSPASRRSIAAILSRSFLTARLLTGNITQAETAVIEAIGLCNPEQENEEDFFETTLRTAAQMQMIAAPAESYEESTNDSCLPIELRRVLELSPELRRCFVLRILAGVPSKVCAQLLRLGATQIDQYCCAAMQALSALDGCG